MSLLLYCEAGLYRRNHKWFLGPHHVPGEPCAVGSIPEVQFVQGSEMSSEVRASLGLESVCDPVHVCTRLHCVPPLPPHPATPDSRQLSMPQKPCHSRHWHILMPCLLCASVGCGKAGSRPTARLMTDARVGLQSYQALSETTWREVGQCTWQWRCLPAPPSAPF